jgi:type I restriction enzyme, S subunit
MSDRNKTPFAELLVDSKDGEWGQGEETVGSRESIIIRGTDFANLDNPAADLPRRWIKNHITDRKRLQPGDIILETAGGTSTQSTGRSALLKKSFFDHHSDVPVLCASFSRHLRLDTYKYSPRFIYYLMQTLHRCGYMAVFNIQHTGVSRFQYTAFKNHTELQIPDLPTQRNVAAILSAYDELIENNQRRIALLKKLAEEIYREWFVRLRFPGHEKVKVVKRVPRGWREAKLEDLIPEIGLQTGKRPKGGAQEVGIPSIGAENVTGLAQHDFSKEKYVSEQFFDSMRQGHIADKDILFYKDGAEIGRVTLLQDGFPHEKCCVNEHVFVIRTHKLAAQYFLYFYLSQPTIHEHVKTINKNAAQPGINKAELRSIPIILPPSELIAEFEGFVSQNIRQIFHLAKAQRVLSKTRDLLLPRLISGKLSLGNLDIQFPSGMAEELNAEPTAASAKTKN